MPLPSQFDRHYKFRPIFQQNSSAAVVDLLHGLQRHGACEATMGIRVSFRAVNAFIPGSVVALLCLKHVYSRGVVAKQHMRYSVEHEILQYSTEHEGNATTGWMAKFACSASFSHEGTLCMTANQPEREE